MHFGRHTFPTNTAVKVPRQTIQKAYRHSSITTTVKYQTNFTHKEAD